MDTGSPVSENATAEIGGSFVPLVAPRSSPEFSRAGEAPPGIVIATVLDRFGGTGVQSHVNALLAGAATFPGTIRLVTPFILPKALLYAAFGPGRLMRPFSTAAWVWWHRDRHYRMIRRALFGALDADTPAVVYAQEPLSARAALEARDAGYPIEVAMVVHFNESQADEWAGMGFIRPNGMLHRRIAALEEHVLPRVDRLIFPSRFMQRELNRRFPAIADVEQWCIPNCAAEPFAASTPALTGDLVSVGSLEPRKNQMYLLEVLQECHRMGFPYTLTLAGDGPLRSALEARVIELDLERYVTFAGYVPDAHRLLPAHRVYVHSARLENLPISLLEALAAGRPVFASPVGGIPEIFTDGVHGRFWSLEDAASGARALIDVLEEPEAYTRMSEAAVARYRERFHPDVVIPALLDGVLGRERTSSPSGGQPRTPTSAGVSRT